MILRIGVFLMLAATSTIDAQSKSDSVKQLETTLKKQPRVMQGFSLDRDVVWRWDGSQFVQQPSLGHILAVVAVNSVKLHGRGLEIDGIRHQLHGDTTLDSGNFDTPVRIYIDLSGADAATVIPKVADAIFFADQPAALAAMPLEYRTQKSLSACPATDARGSQHVTMPKVVHQVDPELSDDARQKKISGNVKVGLRVDVQGVPTDLWVIRPAGHGLDQKAVEAASQYQFAPARCGDLAVPITLFIDVNFQVF